MSTCQGEYRPSPPEALSRVSRFLVVLEFTAALLLCALILHRHLNSQTHEHEPIPFVAVSPSIPITTAMMDDDANPSKGQVLFAQTCTPCHGLRGQGMPHQGANLRASKFVAAR